MLSLSRRQPRTVASHILRSQGLCSTQFAAHSVFRTSQGKKVQSHNLVPIALYSSSRHAESDSSRFQSQRTLLNRQTAKPVLFDELESDDELDFSLEEKPSGEGNSSPSSLVFHDVVTVGLIKELINFCDVYSDFFTSYCC